MGNVCYILTDKIVQSQAESQVKYVGSLRPCLFIPSASVSLHTKKPNATVSCLMQLYIILQRLPLRNSKCVQACEFSYTLYIPSFYHVIKHVFFFPTTTLIIFCFVIKYLLSHRHKKLAVISVFLPLIVRSFEPIQKISQFRREKQAWQLISSF